MEKDLLQAVIKVEKDIQQAVEAERRKAADWLESQRASSSRELALRKQELLTQYDQSIDTTCRLTRSKSEKETAAVARLVEYLGNVPEEILREAVNGQLESILPAVTGIKQ